MLHFSLREKGLDLVAHLIVFAAIYGFLLSYFAPTYLFSKTITTGGDTPSHYAAADYLIKTLLPKGKVIGWMPGNYAGFPLFQFYFPLPFLIVALLQIAMPLQIAFKLVTVLGIFMLPVSAYTCLRLLRQPSPIPLLGAIFTLPFLFMEANSMWGGNIPSTLSGEFAYSLGFALLVLYTGSFYRGITENRYTLINTLILAVIGLAHGYTLLFAVFAQTFFLFTTNGFLKRLWYYLKVNALAFLLLGFWLIQLLWFMPYTTPFNIVWVLDGISQVFPPILYPFIACAVLGTIMGLIHKVRENRGVQKEWPILLYFWFIILLAGYFYFVAYKINLVDIRFLPYVQFFLLLLGAVGIGHMTRWMKAREILAPFLVCLTILWVNQHVTYIPRWIKWDYSGFEAKRNWPQFRAVNEFLKGSYEDPRVVYQHDLKNRATGSVRAFESLPLFSGRSTLEGVYIQSSITSPFVFYLQSEISPKPSCPLPHYNYSRLNIKKGLEHLKLFNVSHLIAVTDDVKKALRGSPDVILEKEYPPYAIYRLRYNPDRYVSVLSYEPTLVITKDWHRIAFEWFRRGELQTHIVFKDKLETSDSRRFRTIIKDNTNQMLSRIKILPRIKIPYILSPSVSPIKETVKPEEVLIETRHIGRPHLVRISYHPNWHAEGAERIYFVSPSFMLIYPIQERVRLYFGSSFPSYLGLVLSFFGLFIVLCSIKPFKNLKFIHYPISTIRSYFSFLSVTPLVIRLGHFRYKKQTLCGVSLGLVGTLLLFLMAVHHKDPTIIFNKGMHYFKKRDYEKARIYFEKGMNTFPISTIIDQTAFHFAITYFKENQWQEALDAFKAVALNYPESRKLPEVLYHIGLCHLRLKKPEKAIRVFKRVTKEFPGYRWAGYAKERLKELGL